MHYLANNLPPKSLTHILYIKSASAFARSLGEVYYFRFVDSWVYFALFLDYLTVFGFAEMCLPKRP